MSTPILLSDTKIEEGFKRPRVLFISEHVTLAHVARPATLFEHIDSERYEAFFACDRRSSGAFLTKIAPERLFVLQSIDKEVFSKRLRRGLPVYSTSELREYVKDDVELIDQVKPDLIVGDFRLSLSVSARKRRIPYACITNAYWSPLMPKRQLPFPVLSRHWSRAIPLRAKQLVFFLFQSLILKSHCRPLNTVRAEHGLESLPLNIQSIYTDADYVLFADSKTLFPLRIYIPSNRYLGPLDWTTPFENPYWWDDLILKEKTQSLVYVTMGSSGSFETLTYILDVLDTMDGICTIVSTAGVTIEHNRWKNALLATYLPGDKAAARSSLVVCNGGSPTTQQALSAGVPVLGICENMDHMLNMRGLVNAGLGISLRADELTTTKVMDSTRLLLKRPRIRTANTPFKTASSELSFFLADLFPGVKQT